MDEMEECVLENAATIYAMLNRIVVSRGPGDLGLIPKMFQSNSGYYYDNIILFPRNIMKMA